MPRCVVEQAEQSISRAHVKGGVHGPHISLGDRHQQLYGGQVDGGLAEAEAEAEARDWKALRVSGNEEFNRMVWLEASARGVKTLGCEPSTADLEVPRTAREPRLVNRIEPATGTSRDTSTAEKASASARGGGSGVSGRKAVLAAIEAVLIAENIPDKQRQAIMAATGKHTQRLHEGRPPRSRSTTKPSLRNGR